MRSQRCWAWRPTAPDRLLSGHHLSSAKGKEEPVSPLPRGRKKEPGPTSCEATGFEEQLNRAANPVKLYRRMLLVFQRVSSTDRSVLD